MRKTSFCTDWLFAAAGDTPCAVDLPHDATQWQGRAADAPSGSAGAYYLGGCYTYRKIFDAPENWRNRSVSLLFEGVYPTAKVLLNGREAGGCAYGYRQFEVALSGLRYGEKNEITVVVDNSKTPNSRWYAGAGIYRPVWLLEGHTSHIPYDGIRVTTLSCSPAEIRVQTVHTGNGTVSVEILDGGTLLARGEGEDIVLTLPGSALWSAEHPNLYLCKVSLKDGDTVLDTARTTFGIRQIRWGMDGLFVNGERVLLKGGCIHHDNGILGARSYDEAEWRRIRRLKEFGFNAIRSAHNPLCRAALEACDTLGMYVMDETWDMWDKHKTAHDYAARFPENWKQDVAAIVAKDYNHPSVILYSIGNEVTEPARPEGVRLAEQIVAEMKKLDNTRPVTGGINIALILMAAMGIEMSGGGDSEKEKKQVGSTEFNEMAAAIGERMLAAAASEQGDAVSTPVLDLLDIAGYNYAQLRYEKEPTLHPNRVLVGSETYPQDLPGNWALIEKCPWVVGDFMWTAWDYLGEVGIGGWVTEAGDQGFAKPYPWKVGDTGALDILGNDNAEAGMAAIVWCARKAPYIAVRPLVGKGTVWYRAAWRGSNAIPSWSWKGCEGEPAEIEVYTKAEEAELFLNGMSLGRKPVQNCRALFQSAYQPGELKAVAYHGDGSRLESVLRSADERTRIVITPEGRPKTGKVLFVDISLCGENGEVESHADEMLKVSVTGGKLLAYGSAKPKTLEEFHSGAYTTYYGRSLAAILAESESLEIHVTGKTMQAVWRGDSAPGAGK